MIRDLQLTGLSLNQIRLQSHHHFDEGLKSYMVSRESKKIDMMNKLADQFYNVDQKQNVII